MKTNELMIGDWILMPNSNNYEKIVAIPTSTQIEVGGNCWINPMACIPIPLTVEILEKNGWEYHTKCGSCIMYMLYEHNFQVFFEENEATMIWHINDIGDTKLSIDDCVYVHTLQHALRLFGLHDLADNFKV